jgi:hypothetical protein
VTKAWPVPGIDPSASLASNARRILGVRIAEYYSYQSVIRDEQAVEELHSLRISAKRLRYTLELFRIVFGESGERQILRVKQIQELLGQIHDHDVRIALIEDELNTLAAEQTAELGRSLATSPTSAHDAITTSALRPPPDDPRRGLLALLGRQYTSRHNVYVSFLQHWEQYQGEGMRADLVRLSVLPLSTDAALDSTIS